MDNKESTQSLKDFIEQKFTSGMEQVFNEADAFEVTPEIFNLLNIDFDNNLIIESNLNDDIKATAVGSHLIKPEEYSRWRFACSKDDQNTQIAYDLLQQSLMARMYVARVRVLASLGKLAPLHAKSLMLMFNSYDYHSLALKHLANANDRASTATFKPAENSPHTQHEEANTDFNFLAYSVQLAWERSFEQFALSANADIELLLQMQNIKGEMYTFEKLPVALQESLNQELTANDMRRVHKLSRGNAMLYSSYLYFLRQRVFKAWMHKAQATLVLGTSKAPHVEQLTRLYMGEQRFEIAKEIAETLDFFNEAVQHCDISHTFTQARFDALQSKLCNGEIKLVCKNFIERAGLSPTAAQYLLKLSEIDSQAFKNVAMLPAQMQIINEGIPVALVFNTAQAVGPKRYCLQELFRSRVARWLSTRCEAMLKANMLPDMNAATELLMALTVFDRLDIANRCYSELHKGNITHYEDTCHQIGSENDLLLEIIQKSRLNLAATVIKSGVPLPWLATTLKIGDFDALRFFKNYPDFAKLLKENMPNRQHLLMLSVENRNSFETKAQITKLIEMHYAKIWLNKTLLMATTSCKQAVPILQKLINEAEKFRGSLAAQLSGSGIKF